MKKLSDDEKAKLQAKIEQERKERIQLITENFSDSSEEAEDANSSDAMKKDIRRWGIWLIILGIIHFIAAGYLDPVWGGIIIIIGILNLCIRRRGMFIVNGAALILVGIMNISGSLLDGFGGWTVFGVLQLVWGAKEIKKFGRYALREVEVSDSPIPSDVEGPSSVTDTDITKANERIVHRFGRR